MNRISDIKAPPPREPKIEESKTEVDKEEIKKRKEFFEGKPKKGRKRKFFAIFSAFLVVLLFFGLLRMVSSEKEFKKDFFATSCSGEWQNPANAQGIPDVLPYGTIESFSEANSAVYKTGPQNLLCQWFNELPDAGEEQKKDPCGKDYELCNLTSTKIHLSFAISNIKNDYSMGEPKDENISEGAFGSLNQEELANNQEKSFGNTTQKTMAEAAQAQENIQTEESATPAETVPPTSTTGTPEATPTSMPEETSTSTPTTKPTTTQPTEDQLNLDARIFLSYSIDNGKTWIPFESMKTVPFSNYLNGGYITLDAPFIKSWYDIENFRIRLEGIVGGEEKIIAYVDSIWLEAVARKKFKAPEDISEKIFSMFEDKKTPKKLEITQEDFEYKIPSDGKIVATVKNPDKSIDGLFRMSFLSERNELVGILIVGSGEFSNFKGYDVPLLDVGNFKYKSFSKNKTESSVEINAKKNWGKTKVKVEYIPISGKKELSLDGLEMNFVPEEISTEGSELIGKASFDAKEKEKKEFDLTIRENGNIIVDLLESGSGGGILLLSLDDSIIGAVQVADNLKERVLFKDMPGGNYKLTVIQADTKAGWDDNKGKRTIKIYSWESVQESNVE